MNKRCLYCYQALEEEGDFHEKCSRIFFGTSAPPSLDFDNDQMQELAKDIVVKSVAVTGVQPKLSLSIEKKPGDPKATRFTIVGLWGNFILKPPSLEFPHLPENEDLTMTLSRVFGINTAAHSLIRLRSGELAYITKRFDREKKQKLALEDMCQLTETLTEDKYRGSMERIGKQIARFSNRPGLDQVYFFEQALFCFLTGNADMHLKNFALLTTLEKDIILSPAYDMLCTKIAMPADQEELALTLNGRKNNLRRSDFDALAKNLGVPEKARENIYARYSDVVKTIGSDWIDISFLPDRMKEQYKEIVRSNSQRIGLC